MGLFKKSKPAPAPKPTPAAKPKRTLEEEAEFRYLQQRENVAQRQQLLELIEEADEYWASLWQENGKKAPALEWHWGPTIPSEDRLCLPLTRPYPWIEAEFAGVTLQWLGWLAVYDETAMDGFVYDVVYDRTFSDAAKRQRANRSVHTLNDLIHLIERFTDPPADEPKPAPPNPFEP